MYYSIRGYYIRVPSENTQYGLKNRLIAKGLEKISPNLYRSILEHISGKKLYLYILVLSEDIIRFHYSFHETFDKLKPNCHLEFDNFKKDIVIEAEDKFSIKTKSLLIKIIPDLLQVRIYNREGELLSSNEPGLGFWSGELDYGKAEIRCYKQFSSLKNPPYIYGLGDKTGSINRWGRRFRNAAHDALGYDSEYTDPLYKDIPFFIHLDKESKNAHGIFFDNFYPKFFDFGRERKPSPYYYFGAEGGELNYYFINGPEIKAVVSRYLDLTGKPPQWPSYTYGYLASGMSYTENSNPLNNDSHCEQNEAKQSAIECNLLEAFKKFEAKNIPTTAFHLSSGYVQDSQGQRQQFIWNKSKFTNPKEFSKQAKALGVKLCANVKPVLLITHPWYKEAENLDLFINNNEGKALVIDYWGGLGSPMDFRKKQTQDWWKTKLKENILGNGINGIWNDNNEYEIFEPHQGYGHEIEMPLIMSKLAYDSSLEFNSSEQPWILSRSGYAGIQKYAQSWTGDNYSSWKSLQYDNAILSSCGLSGLIHMGVDIGGFWGDTPDSELLLRWIQNGVFTPRFCIHSYKENPTEPDMYEKTNPEHFKIIQRFMQLRTELIPYIEKQALKAHQSGIPIMRPTVYDFQDDPKTYEQSFEYMFGDELLIAPIYKPSSEAELREIYLPGANTTWTHYFTGTKYHGGQVIKLELDLETIPVFKRSL